MNPYEAIVADIRRQVTSQVVEALRDEAESIRLDSQLERYKVARTRNFVADALTQVAERLLPADDLDPVADEVESTPAPVEAAPPLPKPAPVEDAPRPYVGTSGVRYSDDELVAAMLADGPITYRPEDAL